MESARHLAANAPDHCLRRLSLTPLCINVARSEPFFHRKEIAMRVNPSDGKCRECGGTLTIIDADDSTMTVESECGTSYLVETDAFNDGAMFYYPEVMAQLLERRSDDDD